MLHDLAHVCALVLTGSSAVGRPEEAPRSAAFHEVRAGLGVLPHAQPCTVSLHG